MDRMPWPGVVHIADNPKYATAANGFCKRFHRTVKEEFFQVAFRKALYESLDRLHTGLDCYLEFYNARAPIRAIAPGDARPARPSRKG